MLSPKFIDKIKITNNSLNLYHRIVSLYNICVYAFINSVRISLKRKGMLLNMKFVFNNSEN